MLEIIECVCKKSKVIFKCIGEDLFSHELTNIKIENNTPGIIFYYCKECGKLLTTSDKAMMVKPY